MFSDNNDAPQRNSSPYSQFEIVMLSFFYFLSLPPQFLLRKKFGKRHLRIFYTSFTSVTIYVLWVGTLMLVPVLLNQKETILTWFYALLVTIMASFHALEIALRRKRGIKIHSKYTGYPRLLALVLLLPDPIKEWIEEWVSLEIAVKGYGEPLMCVMAGFVFAAIEPLLGMVLILNGIGLYMWGQYKSSYDEDRRLDIEDAQLEAEYMQAMLSGKRGADNFGVESYAPRSAKVIFAKSKLPISESEDDTTPRLDPELEKILYSDEEDEQESAVTSHASAKVSNSASNKVVAASVARPRGRPRKESTLYP